MVGSRSRSEFCLQSFSSSGSFPVSQLFASGGQSIGASTSSLVLSEYSGLISFRIDWFDLLAVQGTLKGLLQHCNSKVGKVTSLLFITLSRFVIAFLPRSKRLSISWLQ